MTECSFMGELSLNYIVYFCILNSNMVKPVQNEGIFVCIFTENIEKIGTCVKTGEMY